MLTFRRVGSQMALAASFAVASLMGSAALANHKKQVLVAAPAAAPAYYTTAAAPTYYTTASAPTPTTVSAAPTATAAAPTMTVYQIGSAPTAAAPTATAAAPTAEDPLLAGPFRQALIADLSKLYNADKDATRSDRISTLRDQGATAYAKYLGDADGELTVLQTRDLNVMIAAIVATDLNIAATPSPANSDSPTLQPTTAGAPAAAPVAPPYGYPVAYPYLVAAAPVYAAPVVPVVLVPLVPVQLVPAHRHPWKH